MERSQEVGKYVRFVYDNSDRHTSESDRQNRDAFQTRLMNRGQAKRAGGPPVRIKVLDSERQTHPIHNNHIEAETRSFRFSSKKVGSFSFQAL